MTDLRNTGNLQRTSMSESKGGNRAWLDRIAWSGIAAALGGGVSWASWATVAINDRPTDHEMRRAIIREAPYIEDRKMIHSTLNDARTANRELRVAIDNNTKAIVELQAVMRQLQK